MRAGKDCAICFYIADVKVCVCSRVSAMTCDVNELSMIMVCRVPDALKPFMASKVDFIPFKKRIAANGKLVDL